MADRSFLWGGRNPLQRRPTELGGRRRHDDQRLLVELELDDSMYQNPLRAGMEHNVPRQAGGPTRRTTYAAQETRNFQSSYEQDFIAEPKSRPQARYSRESTPKLLTERQMQQLHAKRLSSPYKLVQGIRKEQSPHHSRTNSVQRVIRSPTLQQSPAQMVIESIQQNIYLRDQVMAHLQQELMGVLPLHRASHVEKNIPQRVVKLLNRMRSLSLAVVEAVVYLSGELGDSDAEGGSSEHEILEQEFYRYLLQMASSDTDFLACSPPLQRFFEDFEVNLTRNPFVDGLTLDSSEVLLCSCHQSSSSGTLFRSALSASSSLLRLLTHKLETFALQTQRYLQGWQIIPAERVAAALLHLMDLETRYNAVRMIPRYLQSQGDNRRHLQQSRGPHNSSQGYGTFEDERIQRLDRQESKPVVEAWTGSTTSKIPAKYGSRPPSARDLTPDLVDHSLPSRTFNELSRSPTRKQESARSAAASTSAWMSISSPTNSESAQESTRRKSVEAVDTVDNMEFSPKVMPLPPLDTAALAKTSRRNNQSERPAAKKRRKKIDEEYESRSRSVDVGIQMSKSNTPVGTSQENVEESFVVLSERLMRDEEMQVYEDRSGNLTSSRRVVTKQEPQSDMNLTLTEADFSELLDQEDERSYVRKEPILLYDVELDTLPSLTQAKSCDAVEMALVENTVEENDDDDYECDFEYSSNEALSNIAMALQMLPNFSFSTSEIIDIDLASEEVKPPDEAEMMVSSRSGQFETYEMASELSPEPISSAATVIPSRTNSFLQDEVTVPMENVVEPVEIVPEDDEYSYSSSTAISNIAMALSLLPNVCKNDMLTVSEKEYDDSKESLENYDSSRIFTYQSIAEAQSPFEVPPHFNLQEPAVDDMPAFFLPTSSHSNVPTVVSSELTTRRDQLEYSLPPSYRYEASSMTSSRSDLLTVRTEQEIPSLLDSSRHVRALTSDHSDAESGELNRIFSLCRDIQETAFDRSHWVSQCEVEEQILSHAQPFSSLMGYSLPTIPVENTPKYLERELKMLRRNFSRWKEASAEQKRAKRVVRRAVARRKIRKFIHFHYQRRLRARRDEIYRFQSLAACRIQRNWGIYRHNQEVSTREAVFRLIHMKFHRMVFFLSISWRRLQRENAKEKIVRWWRHQRSRIKKKIRRQDEILRERERRTRALKDIQKFLKEILLRRKLKAAQEMAKNILFKENLKWTKAKRDVEISMKLNSKHRCELIADMNAKLSDLDRRWKTSEDERLKLLTHHERVVQQQQNAVEVRRRKLAAMKIQMFFRVCELHKKLQRVEKEKKNYALTLHKELLSKEKLGVEMEKRVGKTRTQVRVLERKLNRMSLRAVQTETHHRSVVQAHENRERISKERAAKQKIKAFIDARVLVRRLEREKRRMLLQHAHLQAEKTEIELMSSEDQNEHQRRAASIAFELRERLFELESRSEELLNAKNELAVEKELEASRAVVLLERKRVESSMQMISSWVSGQMKLSKVKKEKAAICVSAAIEMAGEKRRQRQEIDAKTQEINSVKASSFMHQRMTQHRNHRTVEMLKAQQEQKATQERRIAERTRSQLVQLIIAVKLLAESECSKGVSLALDTVARIHKAAEYKATRINYLRRMNSARKLQRTWRRWELQQGIKRLQQQALAQFELARQRQALARKVQTWWRKWAQEQQRQREQQRVFDAHLESIRVRVNVRKIQRIWRRWVVRRCEEKFAFDAHLTAICIRANVRIFQRLWRSWVLRERERRLAQELAFESHLEDIRVRANSRKIQKVWRRWMVREQERRLKQQQLVASRLEMIFIRANVRKIQGAWKRWIIREKERRIQHQIALKAIRIRANVRKIQRVWRRWNVREQERRHQLQMLFNEHLESIRVRANVRKIQRFWRRWIVCDQERRRKQQALEMRLKAIHTGANVRKIQRAWRQYAKRERDRKCQQKQAFEAHFEAIVLRALARKIQVVWRRWVRCNRKRRESQRVASTLRIQKWWRRQQQQAERTRVVRETSAQVIQKMWLIWQEKEKEKQRIRIQREVCARKAQQFREKKLRRERSASRIQRRWRKWRKEKIDSERVLEAQKFAVMIVQRNWRMWLCKFNYEKEKARRCRSLITIQRTCYQWWQQKQQLAELKRRKDELIQQTYTGNALKIQTFWRKDRQQRSKVRDKERLLQTRNTSSLTIQRNWGNRHHRRKMERERVQYEQHMSALKIQTLWLKWHHEQQEELEREQIRQEQYESSLKIQRNWVISQRRQKVANERLRHQQNLSVLKIQKRWRRWRHLRLEQKNRKRSEVAESKRQRSSSSTINTELQMVDQLQQQKLDVIKRRSYGKSIARAVNKYHQYRRRNEAATIIEATWKGKICRMQYLDVLEVQRAEEARQYRLMISVFASKVQKCWRRWHSSVRHVKRSIVKDSELRLISEAKAIERKVLMARRSYAAKQIQRAVVSRRKRQVSQDICNDSVVMTGMLEESINKAVNEEPKESLETDGDLTGPLETPQENSTRADVEKTVEDWSHRELTHILTRSVNQILFYHDAANVLQKFVRSYQKRQKMHFYFQRSFDIPPPLKKRGDEYFLFFFRNASAWLEWERSKSSSAAKMLTDSNKSLRLRLDSQLTRKLLQLLEPEEEYLPSEIHQVLHELANDVLPILQSSICVQNNNNLRPELCYHDVDEMELPRSVALLRQMGQHRAQIRRQQLLEIDTISVSEVSAIVPPPSANSTLVRKEVTIFTAVEDASVEDATFLQHRGADFAAVEPKMQRSLLHMMSFSKETYRARAEMLEFLLNCGANLNVNAVDCNGDTPLMLYASLGHLNFIRKLLEYGADIQMINSKGQNVLHRACKDDQVEICEYLQQLMMKDSVAENLIPVETVAALTSEALSLHTPDKTGRYPMHYLAKKGFLECAKQLLVPTEANYEWNRTLQAQGDAQGRTALHVAVLAHDTAMTTFLLIPGGGSNVNTFDDLHRSPVHYAVESPAALSLITRLVQHRANLNVADERGDTPLHWAAFSGRAAVAQHLLALGADPTFVNSDWETPVQIAAAYGQHECMRLLFQSQRRHEAASTDESNEQQPQHTLPRLDSEKTALQRLEEAVNNLHEKQATGQSQGESINQNSLSTVAAGNKDALQAGGYWEELHQDVQLVEESGQFSSEDEENMLFSHNDDF